MSNLILIAVEIFLLFSLVELIMAGDGDIIQIGGNKHTENASKPSISNSNNGNSRKNTTNETLGGNTHNTATPAPNGRYTHTISRPVGLPNGGNTHKITTPVPNGGNTPENTTPVTHGGNTPENTTPVTHGGNTPENTTPVNNEKDNSNTNIWNSVIESDHENTPGWARFDRMCDEDVIRSPANSSFQVKYGPYPLPIDYIYVLSDDMDFKGTAIIEGGIHNKQTTLAFRGGIDKEITYLAMFCWKKDLI